MPASSEGYAKMPNWLARTGYLNPYEYLVYAYLLGRANPDGKAWPSLNLIARETGISKSTVRRTLDRLAERGIVTRTTTRTERGDYDRTTYRVKRFTLSRPTALGGVFTESTPLETAEAEGCGQSDAGCGHPDHGGVSSGSTEVEPVRTRSREEGQAPPPRYCSKHPEGTDTPCRPCGRAREAREAWEAAEAAKPRPPRPHVHRPANDGTCIGGDDCTDVQHPDTGGWVSWNDPSLPEVGR